MNYFAINIKVLVLDMLSLSLSPISMYSYILIPFHLTELRLMVRTP